MREKGGILQDIKRLVRTLATLIITVASFKGGVVKTTSAVHLVAYL
jgi:hypothetical protein